MSKRLDKDSLDDIKEAIKRIRLYTKDSSYKKFLKDIKCQDAVVRNLEILGEATKNISSALKEKHPLLPWRKLAGVRDRLIHHYFGVNLDIVWTILHEELPSLALEIEKILKKK
jgi:uncharacterized protein with HEPN domain